jgi:DNA segregation ATPase FtsK/SpoIIIE-like protein
VEEQLKPDRAAADADAAHSRLWLCIDGLPELLDAAARLGRPDIQDTLAVLARKARYADILLLTTVGDDRLLQLRPALRAQLTVRIAMGSVEPDVSTALFGGTLELGGSRRLAPGRGYARVGNGPVIRLQTPYAPPGDVSPLRAVGTTASRAAQAAMLTPSAG